MLQSYQLSINKSPYYLLTDSIAPINFNNKKGYFVKNNHSII